MGSIQTFIFNTLCSLPAVIFAITIQGYSKAKMADILGDKLPRIQGRVSLNPSAHIDLYGLLMLVVLRFGWMKPVETNPSAYKNGYKDSIKVSVAPLVGNLITAFIFTFIYYGTFKFLIPHINFSMAIVLELVLFYMITVNLSLMVFNLLPLPGLCGWNILKDLNPRFFFKISGQIYQYQLPILLVVILLGRGFLAYPVRIIFTLFSFLARLVFRI